MALVTLAHESEHQAGGFYVPRFEVKIEGAGLPKDVLRDVTEVTYKDNIDELDSFELTVNNWDTATQAFKYIGSETDNDLQAGREPGRLFTLFEPCAKEISLSMGYLDQMKLMITGTFTTMEPNFSSSGAPTLNVRGLNLLHQLRRKKYDGAWINKTDSEIAKNIATLKDPDSKKKKTSITRFPLPITINDEARNKEEKIDFVGQKKEFDIDFLWKRAQTRGYVVLIQEERKNPSNQHPRRLYFGPSLRSEDRPTYVLEWGKSLIDLKPTLTTANQFKSVTVNGWDRKRQKPISVTVDVDDKELRKLNANLHELIMHCDPREEFVVDEPVFSKKQAEQRARALLLDQHKQMVKASGSTVGLPELRAGAKVEILGIGSRLSGTYFVTETTHTINDNGYITKFKARREDEKSEPKGQGEANR